MLKKFIFFDRSNSTLPKIKVILLISAFSYWNNQVHWNILMITYKFEHLLFLIHCTLDIENLCRLFFARLHLKVTFNFCPTISMLNRISKLPISDCVTTASTTTGAIVVTVFLSASLFIRIAITSNFLTNFNSVCPEILPFWGVQKSMCQYFRTQDMWNIMRTYNYSVWGVAN